MGSLRSLRRPDRHDLIYPEDRFLQHFHKYIRMVRDKMGWTWVEHYPVLNGKMLVVVFTHEETLNHFSWAGGIRVKDAIVLNKINHRFAIDTRSGDVFPWPDLFTTIGNIYHTVS
jgi:hypothetical protein